MYFGSTHNLLYITFLRRYLISSFGSLNNSKHRPSIAVLNPWVTFQQNVTSMMLVDIAAAIISQLIYSHIWIIFPGAMFILLLREFVSCLNSNFAAKNISNRRTFFGQTINKFLIHRVCKKFKEAKPTSYSLHQNKNWISDEVTWVCGARVHRIYRNKARKIWQI